MRVELSLESCLRLWAKQCKAFKDELAFEVSLDSVDRAVDVVSFHLNSIAPLWLIYRSGERVGVYMVPYEKLASVLEDAIRLLEIVSLVNPSTGDGVTIDASDEDGAFPVLQVGGWGECSEFVRSVSSGFSDVHWMYGSSPKIE